MSNQEALQIPWSVEQTIENLKIIKIHYQEVVKKANRDGMGEKDAMEVAFDFDRAITALEQQDETTSEGDLASRAEVIRHIEDIKCSDLPKNYGTLLDILRWLRYTLSCAYNYDSVMEQLDGAAVTRFEGRLEDGRVCHYEDIKYIVRTGGKHPK